MSDNVSLKEQAKREAFLEILSENECPICHEIIEIPTTPIKIFPCMLPTKDGQSHKWSACLHCLREYLQLNKSREERTETRRCLYCDARVQLHELRGASDIYEIDHERMRQLTILAKNAGHKFVCKCGFSTSDQHELWHHRRDEAGDKRCPLAYVQCGWMGCYARVLYQDLKAHMRTCPCGPKCLKCGFDKFETVDEWTNHGKSCPKRVITCPCMPNSCIGCSFDELDPHLRHHIEVFELRIKDHEESIIKLRRDRENVLVLLKGLESGGHFAENPHEQPGHADDAEAEPPRQGDRGASPHADFMNPDDDHSIDPLEVIYSCMECSIATERDPVRMGIHLRIAHPGNVVCRVRCSVFNPLHSNESYRETFTHLNITDFKMYRDYNGNPKWIKEKLRIWVCPQCGDRMSERYRNSHEC